MTMHVRAPLPFGPKVAVSIVAVTPDTARRWLQRNGINRPLRDYRINLYASEMVAGRWTVDASAICFDSQDRLLNGQHRLHAVVRSNRTIHFT